MRRHRIHSPIDTIFHWLQAAERLVRVLGGVVDIVVDVVGLFDDFV